MISWLSVNISGHKLGHLAKLKEYLVNTLNTAVFSSSSLNNCQNVRLGDSQAKVETWVTCGQQIGHKFKLKEYLVNTLEAAFLSFNSMLKLCQNNCLDVILENSWPSSNMGHVRS